MKCPTVIRTALTRTTLPVVTAAVVLSGVTVAAAPSISGATAGADTSAAAAAPAEAAAPAIRPAPANFPVTFTVGLKRSDAAAARVLARRATPGTRHFRHWLTRTEVRQRFGATPSTLRLVRTYFEANGFKVQFDSVRTWAAVTGPFARWSRFLGKDVQVIPNDSEQNLPGTTFVGSGRIPMPPRVGAVVREQVLGSPTSRQFLPPDSAATTSGSAGTAPDAARASATTVAQASPPRPRNTGTWVGGCSAARLKHRSTYSVPQVKSAYRATGAARRIGVVTIAEGISPRSMRAAQRCWGWPQRSLRIVKSLGQQRPAAEVASDNFSEAALDAQMVRGMVPGLRITNYQNWSNQWYLAYTQIIADRQRPDVVTMSYGWCEQTANAFGPRSLTDAQFSRLGLLGVTLITPTGDEGASDCGPDQGRRIGWPSDTPFFTAVGGTRLSLRRNNERRNEVVWNDLRWLDPDNAGGATGGGTSRLYPRPSWQSTAVVGNRTGRSTPDLSVHASRLPGWPVVLAGSGRPVWTLNSGTSAASPLVAAQVAVIAAQRRARGLPALGLLAPTLYRDYATQRSAWFDVTRGSNRFYAKAGGYRAKAGYDRASGLGVPRFERLSQSLLN